MFWVGPNNGSMQTLQMVRRLRHLVSLYTHTRIIATCPSCDNGRAYFYQLQIRSADEPMTTCTVFYPFRLHTLTFLYSLSVCNFSFSCRVYLTSYLVALHVRTIGERISMTLDIIPQELCFMTAWGPKKASSCPQHVILPHTNVPNTWPVYEISRSWREGERAATSPCTIPSS